jgi:predicted HicB family RNase H-like nuclease
VDILNYKGYEGSAELDMERKVCKGRLLFVDDLVTYEADSPIRLQREFEAAVDDYLETCAALGRDPKKPLKGQFNVRVPPALHAAAVRRALAANVSLNEVVVRALDAFVSARPNNFRHDVVVTIQGSEDVIAVLASASQQPKWTTRSVNH